MKNSIVLIIFLLFNICCKNEDLKSNQKSKSKISSVYEVKEGMDSVVFTPEVANLSFNEVTDLYGIPLNSNMINSTSAKGRMPKYLVNFLNSEDSIVYAKVVRWKTDSLFREISFKLKNDNWIAIGGHTIKANKD